MILFNKENQVHYPVLMILIDERINFFLFMLQKLMKVHTENLLINILLNIGGLKKKGFYVYYFFFFRKFNF